MTQIFRKFSSIDQLKGVVKAVRDHCNKYQKPLPKLKFTGSVKLHGTNAAIVSQPDGQGGDTHFQSRERILSITSDNAGFCMFGERIRQNGDLDKLMCNVLLKYPESVNKTIAVYGEWAGPGVQSGVGISMIPNKKFFVFNISIIDDEDNKIELSPEQIREVMHRTDDIRCIYDFKTWEIEIDFNTPNLVQNQLVEWTLQVEEECPVAEAFGFSGIGEGIVWWNHELDLKFKVKGEKHSSSKVKTVKQIAAVDIERMNSAQEFVDSVVSENRLNQGLSKMGELGLEIDIKNTGAYIRWVVQDGLKEENDVIVASCFDIKELTPLMSAKAKNFWFEQLSKV